jgi:uncharacterized circularly permuted ATP-grasp superfamily protein
MYETQGLLNAMLTGKVATNYSPGVNFVEDKEFYVYVEDLIRHYFHEEPVLKNIPTERFAKTGSDGRIGVDRTLLARVFKNPENYVIKAVDGLGGDSVWVGAKTPPEQFVHVRQKILAEPERYIVQNFTHLSVMDGTITDLRMLSAVGPGGVFVLPIPWGRDLPMDGDGKVNISLKGRQVVVMVMRSILSAARSRCVRKAFSIKGDSPKSGPD